MGKSCGYLDMNGEGVTVFSFVFSFSFNLTFNVLTDTLIYFSDKHGIHSYCVPGMVAPGKC